MHEWAPEERTHVTSWRLLVAPLMDHICRTYLPRCDAVTTIGPSIADLYRPGEPPAGLPRSRVLGRGRLET